MDPRPSLYHSELGQEQSTGVNRDGLLNPTDL
jgi:hypothetical protein